MTQTGTATIDRVDGDETIQPDPRAVYTGSLRDLADFLDEHPEIPVDTFDLLGPAYRDPKLEPDELAAITAALGPTMQIDDTSIASGLLLQRDFGPLTYRVGVDRSVLCEERKVTHDVYALKPEFLEHATPQVLAKLGPERNQ